MWAQVAEANDQQTTVAATLAECEAAAAELYRCELALHDAHQSGVDSWVRAAGDHLHAVLLRHYRAEAALHGHTAFSAMVAGAA
ncbi:MAG: hypothetical protein QOH14_1445 [Pseudonocardiales bacterium]|jgi:hypothetical protein|nr:hypothetical protein [Pseudonocardiales bacterium]